MFVDTRTVSVIGIKHESEHIVLLSLLYQSSFCVCTVEKNVIACGLLDGIHVTVQLLLL